MAPNTKNSRSDLKSTCSIGGRNFSIHVDAKEDYPLVPAISITPEFPDGCPIGGRTTMEIVNEGSGPVRVWFKDSVFDDGRLLKTGEAVAYAINDDVVLYVRAVSGTARVQVTEMI